MGTALAVENLGQRNFGRGKRGWEVTFTYYQSGRGKKGLSVGKKIRFFMKIDRDKFCPTNKKGEKKEIPCGDGQSIGSGPPKTGENALK